MTVPRIDRNGRPIREAVDPLAAEYLHVQMAATHWTECIVLGATADRYVVLFYDHFVEDYLVYRVAKDRVRWP
jgi:hypothetical protein